MTLFVEGAAPGARGADPDWPDERVAQEASRLEALSPEDRLRLAVEWFGADLLFTSSFGADAAYLLHLWSRAAPLQPVRFVDTGFLHEETLVYRDELVALLGLCVEVVRPVRAQKDFLSAFGHDVPFVDPDLCCAHNKVAPIAGHVGRARGWVSGLRRDQSERRSSLPCVERASEGALKVYPLASVTSAQVRSYYAEHALPEHPLRGRRYLSIGCEPCTRPVDEGESPRAGRWTGKGKTECGLHEAPRSPPPELAAERLTPELEREAGASPR